MYCFDQFLINIWKSILLEYKSFNGKNVIKKINQSIGWCHLLNYTHCTTDQNGKSKTIPHAQAYLAYNAGGGGGGG